MTIHNEAMPGEIADVVIMPGDPKRASYIAEKYLFDYELVNDVRGMKAYTGYYHGKRVTIMASGMGIPSMGIYAYELFKFYNVEKIIRIGSSGALDRRVKLLDLVIASSSYSESTFAYCFSGNSNKTMYPSEKLNNKIIETAIKNKIPYHLGKVYCSDVFDVYTDISHVLKNTSNDFLASEMESFALFHMAQICNKEAACILTIVDSKYQKESLTSIEREKSLDRMIELALESFLD